MLERLHTGLALLALLMGLIHCALALGARSFALDVLWFIGSGAAIVCVALSNLLRAKPPTTLSSFNLLFQNALMATFFAGAWIVLPEPQVIAGGTLFGIMSLLSIVAVRPRKAS